MKKNKTDESEFETYLSEARRTVEQWPEWKRNTLGPISPPPKKNQHTKDKHSSEGSSNTGRS